LNLSDDGSGAPLTDPNARLVLYVEDDPAVPKLGVVALEDAGSGSSPSDRASTLLVSSSSPARLSARW